VLLRVLHVPRVAYLHTFSRPNAAVFHHIVRILRAVVLLRPLQRRQVPALSARPTRDHPTGSRAPAPTSSFPLSGACTRPARSTGTRSAPLGVVAQFQIESKIWKIISLVGLPCFGNFPFGAKPWSWERGLCGRHSSHTHTPPPPTSPDDPHSVALNAMRLPAAAAPRARTTATLAAAALALLLTVSSPSLRSAHAEDAPQLHTAAAGRALLDVPFGVDIGGGDIEPDDLDEADYGLVGKGECARCRARRRILPVSFALFPLPLGFSQSVFCA